MECIYLFSRDMRTHSLFRASWENAIKDLNLCVFSELRFNGRFGFVGSLLRFNGVRSSRRIIFGSSEILLYALVSNKTDVWVFTGLGRLLDGSSPRVCKVLFVFLRLVYRNQKVIVLNTDDRIVVNENLTMNTFLIPGEGYKFNASESCLSPIRKGISYAYVGRLLYSKGIVDILNAFASASTTEDELFLFGDFDFGNSDSLEQSAFESFQKYSKGKIQHMGFVTNITEELQRIDVVISMSRREGLPFAILDAIASGCTIILSRVPGHKEFDGLEGVSFVDTSEELREVMYTRHDDLKRLSLMEHEKRLQLADKRFGFENVTTLIKLYLK